MGITTQNTSVFSYPQTQKLILVASALTFVFFTTFWLVIPNVYRYPVVGAIYEFLWLPMILLLFVIPVLVLIMIIKNKQAIWFGVGSLILIIAAFLIIYLKADSSLFYY